MPWSNINPNATFAATGQVVVTSPASVIYGAAAENLTQYYCCAIRTPGIIELTDARDITKVDFCGVATASVLTGQYLSVQGGIILKCAFTALPTINFPAYISRTPGKLVDNTSSFLPGDQIVQVGFVLDVTPYATDGTALVFIGGSSSLTSTAGLDFKGSARVGSVANIAGTYANTGGSSGRGRFTLMPNTVDGTALAANNIVALIGQTNKDENGLWQVLTLGTGANGIWERATNFDSDIEVTCGAYFTIEESATDLAGSAWILTTPNPIQIGGAGGTLLTFQRMPLFGKQAITLEEMTAPGDPGANKMSLYIVDNGIASPNNRTQLYLKWKGGSTTLLAESPAS